MNIFFFFWIRIKIGTWKIDLPFFFNSSFSNNGILLDLFAT